MLSTSERPSIFRRMKGIAKLKRALKDNTDFAFERLVGELLNSLLVPIVATRRMGRLDRQGVDAYVVGDETIETEIVVQCKGFEAVEYGKDQHRQCLDEVRKFQKKGPKTKEYWLVINRPIINRDQRTELMESLGSLIKDGKVRNAQLLDLDHFEKKLRKLGSSCLETWAENKRIDYNKFYRSHIEFVAPIRQVPFKAENEGQDPSKFIFKSLQQFYSGLVDAKTGKNRHAPQFLLTSSFGFGKTTTLHLLANDWLENGQKLIFIPAAVMGDRAFSAAAGVAAEMLNFLIPEDTDVPKLVYEMLRDVLKSDLSKSSGWTVLIDGIDENPYSLNPNCITALSDGLKDVGIPAVISTRSELADTRPIEFTKGFNPTVPLPFIRMELGDWPDELIVEFVSEFENRQNDDPPDSFREFRKLIENGRYADVYSDIPKRPLFLGMMVVDAWSGKQPERELHQLYGSYFRRKFERDRTDVFEGGSSLRPSQLVERFGAEEACERLVQIMQRAARDMTTQISSDGETRRMVEQDVISERAVTDIATSCGIPFVQIEDVLLHSLLQPAGRNRQTRERQFRFAHRSFQDWFLARDLVTDDEFEFDSLPAAVKKFLAPMRTDWERGIGLP